jgi:putative lipoprotein
MVGARSVLLFVSAVFALCLFGFAQSGSASPVITGTVTYQARMALPSNAAINVRLEDVTLANAPAKLVADNMFSAAGQQLPISFQLPYSVKDVNPSHRYVVRATIKSGDKLLFTTTQAYPVLTNGAPNTVALVLKPVGGAPAAAKLAAGALRGTYWMLTELHGKSRDSGEQQSGLHLSGPDGDELFRLIGVQQDLGDLSIER